MRKYLLIFAAIVCLCLVVLGISLFKSNPKGKKEEAISSDTDIITGISVAVVKLERMTFNELIPDHVVKQALHNFLYYNKGHSAKISSFRANTEARHVVFEDNLQAPFKDYKQYYGALYAAYSAGSERRQKWYANDDGIPFEIIPYLEKARELIMEKARAYLKDPRNLWAFYQAKKTIILSEIKEQPSEVQTDSVAWLEKAKKGLEIFSDPQFQIAYRNYHNAYSDWWNVATKKEWETASAYNEITKQLLATLSEGEFLKQIKSRTGWNYVGQKGRPYKPEVTVAVPHEVKAIYTDYQAKEVVWADAEQAGFQAYLKMNTLKEKMDKLTPDSYASLFAGRRFQEGGNELMVIYIKIATDIITSL